MIPNSQLAPNPAVISDTTNYVNIEDISENEIETIDTDKVNSNATIDKWIEGNNGLFFTGNTVAAIGNGLLWANGILPAGPAVCFISDGTVGALTSLSRLLMYKFDYKNKTIDNILMWINLSQFSLLDAAVIQLNLPLPLNPKYQSVWGCFIPAASIATLNSILGTTNVCSKNDEQQPSNSKKTYNTVVSILPNIGVNLALTGVLNMSQIYLNDHQDDENKNNAETAFYVTGVGIGIVSVALAISTALQLTKSWCKSTQSLSEDEIRIINEDNNISDDSVFQQSNDNEISFSDIESITSEEIIHAQYGKKICPPCTIL